MSDGTEEQRLLILDQFTGQAVPFADMPAHSNDEGNRLLIEMARIGPEDTVLDVACGPGLTRRMPCGRRDILTGRHTYDERM